MSVSRVNALRAFAVGLGNEVESNAVGLGDFSPGIDASRAQGVKITRDTYALGDAGTLGQSIPMVLQKIREGRLDPAVRGWVGDVLWKAGDPQGVRAKCNAILDAFRAATVYAPDPAGAEYIVAAAATLCLRPGLCIRASDCDDRTTAVGSCLSSINIPVWVVFQDFGAGKQQHVLLGSQDETGNKFYIDPSTKWPVGNAAQAVREEWFDPLDGLPAPEIVGVGWSPVEPKFSEPAVHEDWDHSLLGFGADRDLSQERHLVKRADGLWWEYAGGSWHREVRASSSEVGVGSVGSWERADWSDMKPIVHEVGLGPNCPGGCGKKRVFETPQLREVGLNPDFSLAATPTPGPAQTTEYIDADASSVQAGARYYFAIKTDLSASDLQTVLTDDWNPIEEFIQDFPGFYRVRAIAAHDAPLKVNGDVSGLFGFSKGNVQILSILVEVASGTTTPIIPAVGSTAPDNSPPEIDTTPVAPTGSISGTGVILTAIGGAALGGYLWGLHKRHKRLFGRRRAY